VPDSTVRAQVVGANEISRIDLAAVDELVDLAMIRVDSSATFSSSSLVTSMKVSVVALDDVLVVDLLAGVGVHLGVSATGQVTRERRKKPFQLARGAMPGNSDTDTGFKTNDLAWFRHGDPSHRRIFLSGCPVGLDICSGYVLIQT